jgi:UDP-glucose 4-epimerase
LLADGQAVSTPELCAALGRALGRRARLFPFPPALLPLRSLTSSLEVDDAAIRRELAWKPPFSMEEGLRATADWYRRR